MNTAAAIRAHRGPAVFSVGLRPFFLFSALWAAIAAPLWLYAFLSGGPVGLSWHVHEMLFGYTGGIVVGFLLTAVPNWTGRLPVVGTPLALLFGLWLAGRAAMLAMALNADLASEVWPLIIDGLFLFAMAGVVWREVLAGKNWRNVPVAVMVTLFALANAGFHLEAGAGGIANLSTRLGLAVVALLIAVIGGRVTPSFTRNWQTKRGGPMPAVSGRLDVVTLAVTAAGLVAWSVAPTHPAAGALLLASGGLNLVRLVRWRGDATVAEPLVWILHLGYLWLAAGLLFTGLSVAAPGLVPPSVGVHALTAGAIGVMTLAIMTRASRGHTGRPLAAGRIEVLIYVLINAAALTRVTGGLLPTLYQPLLMVSAGLWSAAFLGFVVGYGPMLLSHRPDRA
ncbi:MAG: NnrS family protein [Brevundimonas sp.]|uniref:NnrS family protein n=1 Tax=Brevundimonas sp. TaxID=1871086 RepID=UPI002726AC2F|nr:NnrS family protein [Brevundimonas sp.]MDO9075842.1 NnrS family protein [Brevundimonas sp.]MDP3081451.1 NnrS family protein [Brevundimonas sp.]MDZ4060019.1 NnrS family protein [Brevundimonas sp.]